MKKHEIPAELKELRKKSGLSAKEATKRLKELSIDISPNTIYGYESGLSMPNANVYVALRCVYEGKTGLQEVDSKHVHVISEIDRKYRALDKHGKELVDFILNKEYARSISASIADKEQAAASETRGSGGIVIQLPRYDKVSAGNGEVVFNGSVESLVAVRATEAAKRADYIVDVNGDSMEPEYHSGEMVLVEKKDSIEQGKIGIFILNGDSYIKKFGANGLISLNKKYPEITIKETDSLWFFGEVIGKAELAGD